jgi:hypothetical protein
VLLMPHSLAEEIAAEHIAWWRLRGGTVLELYAGLDLPTWTLLPTWGEATHLLAELWLSTQEGSRLAP